MYLNSDYLGSRYRIVSVAPRPFGGMDRIVSPSCMAAIITLQQVGIA